MAATRSASMDRVDAMGLRRYNNRNQATAEDKNILVMGYGRIFLKK